MDGAPMKTWWSKDLAEHLGIGNSTLRKWSSELEKAGYIFLRDEHNRRAYVEHDAIALRVFKKYLENGMSYNSAAKAVTTDYLRLDSASIAISANSEKTEEARYDERYEAVEAKIDELQGDMTRLIEMNQALFARLDQQQQYIEESMNKRDAQLLAALREMREERKQLAAAKEEVKRKPFWKRLFE